MAILNAQLIAGVVVGLVIWILMSDRPFLRDVLVTVAAASILDVLTGRQSPQAVGSVIEAISKEISVHPHFTLGVILAATTATLMSRLMERPKIEE